MAVEFFKDMLIQKFSWLVLVAVALTACGGPSVLIEPESGETFTEAEGSIQSVVSLVPDYTHSLNTLSGKGRALISEPGNSDRVTIDFSSDRNASLMTIQNRIGIEGGQLLVSGDSILIYNKLDQIAQKLSVNDGYKTSLNELVTVNLINLFNYTISGSAIRTLYESENMFWLQSDGGSNIFIDRDTGRVQKVEHRRNSGYPYSRIIYENYGNLEGFILPRKITIFSSDKSSRVIFIVRALEVNPDNLNLLIDIPENIEIQRL